MSAMLVFGGAIVAVGSRGAVVCLLTMEILRLVVAVFGSRFLGYV